ncbi:unnamed protein product, partial [Nesidiocoris tenuis]
MEPQGYPTYPTPNSRHHRRPTRGNRSETLKVVRRLLKAFQVLPKDSLNLSYP